MKTPIDLVCDGGSENQRLRCALEAQAAYQALSQALAGTVLLGDDGTGVPKAYLNYLLFDSDFQLVAQGFAQVSQAAKTTTTSTAEALNLELDIAQGGYLYTYLFNESDASCNNGT